MSLYPAKPPGTYAEGLVAPSSRAPARVYSHWFTGVEIPFARGALPRTRSSTTPRWTATRVPVGVRARSDALLKAAFRMTLADPRRAGRELVIPLTLENVGAGHRVPAGFSQERETWVELEVTDARGLSVYEVGRLRRPEDDLADKRFVRVTSVPSQEDGRGRPLGLFGADVVDGPDVPRWSPDPRLGGTRFTGSGLVNLQNGFQRCVRCVGVVDALGHCVAREGQGITRADRFADGAYDPDTGECRSYLAGEDALLETYFPVGARDADRGVGKAPDAIVDTRSAPPGAVLCHLHLRPRHARPGSALLRACAPALPRVPALPGARLRRLRARPRPRRRAPERPPGRGRHAPARRSRRDRAAPRGPSLDRRVGSAMTRWPEAVWTSPWLRGVDAVGREAIEAAGTLRSLAKGAQRTPRRASRQTRCSSVGEARRRAGGPPRRDGGAPAAPGRRGGHAGRGGHRASGRLARRGGDVRHGGGRRGGAGGGLPARGGQGDRRGRRGNRGGAALLPGPRARRAAPPRRSAPPSRTPTSRRWSPSPCPGRSPATRSSSPPAIPRRTCSSWATGMVQARDGGEGQGARAGRALVARGSGRGRRAGGRGAHDVTVAACGSAWVLAVPREPLVRALRRSPGALDRARRLTGSPPLPEATRHVMGDLWRFATAGSMLVIDDEACVRCGACAAACAGSHDDGVSRLVRRGEKVAVRDAQDHGSQRALLIPGSCQHCKHPACMIDCPTGAIGRDPAGGVFVREELCVGCGRCESACPWGAVQMAPRVVDGKRRLPLAPPPARGSAAGPLKPRSPPRSR